MECSQNHFLSKRARQKNVGRTFKEKFPRKLTVLKVDIKPVRRLIEPMIGREMRQAEPLRIKRQVKERKGLRVNFTGIRKSI